MKYRSVVAGIDAALLLILVVAGVFLNAVRNEAVSVELYDRRSREAVAEMHGGEPVEDAAMVDAYIGMDSERQHRFAETLSAYMKGSSDELPEELNEKERVHFADVRRLIRLAERVSRYSLGLSAILVFALAWLTRMPGVHALRVVCAGLAAGASCIALFALWASRNFTTAFVWMHQMLFSNDFWQMDPRTDIIIRVMPAGLFEQAAVRCIRQAAVQLAVILPLLIVLYFFMRRLIGQWVREPEAG